MTAPAFPGKLASSEGWLRLCWKLRRRWRRDGRFIVISAMPKSGSTFLSMALSEATGFARSYFGYSYRNVEQELYLPKLIDAFGRGTVVHQHFRSNPANLDLIRQFGIRPVILLRNLFDCAVSVRDHLVGEATDNLPAVVAPAGFGGRSSHDQFDYIVDFVMPWYVSFFASWKYAERGAGIPILWLHYEQMVRNWHDSVQQVLRFNGLDVDAATVDAAIQRVLGKPREKIRLNQGRSGRGVESLSAAQMDRLRSLTRSYPDVDFSPLGI